jgi:hypothetical protein
MFATKTRLIAAAAVMAGTLCAGAAQASNVSWSIGINAPIGPGASIGTVISGGAPMPVVYAPAPVVYTPPPPVYVAPAPVVYTPPPVVYRPAPVVVEPVPVYVPRRVVMAPVWFGGRWIYPDSHRNHHHHHRDGWRDGRGHWDDGDRRGPPVYEPQGGWGRGHR